jgi:hypothetical protein
MAAGLAALRQHAGPRMAAGLGVLRKRGLDSLESSRGYPDSSLLHCSRGYPDSSLFHCSKGYADSYPRSMLARVAKA